MATNDLSWTATVVDNKDWIHLNPQSGSGDKTIEVTVDNYDGYSEDVTGEVIITCTGCKTDTEPKRINVCRCACNCDNMQFTQKVNKIPEGGLGVENPLVTYSIDNRCNANRIGAKIINTKTSVEQSLTVNSSGIYLQSPIPYNEDEEQVTYDIVITFDGAAHTCRTFQITQAALECNCTASIISLVYEPILTNGVPQSGIQADTKILTYELKQHCKLEDLSIVLSYVDDGGTRRTRSIRLENGNGFLKTAIEGNNTVNNREITSTVKWGTEECPGKTFQQEGCKCRTALVEDSFTVSISTFGVTGGTEIGSYSINPQTMCPETALTATLKNKNTGVIYTLVCNNGKVYLADSDEIAENETKNPVYFELVVYYNGFECDRADIYQNGVDCNCDDLTSERAVSLYYNSTSNTIPKEGLTAGTPFGEYRLTNPKCKDDNDCFKIEEATNTIHLQLIDNQIKLIDAIPNNEDPITIDYAFVVSYKVNNKWKECKTLYAKQDGLECSCDSINISTEVGNLPSFPYEGTHNRWIQFASGDTAMYKSNQEFAGVCGKLIAIDNSEYLNVDEEEDVEYRVSNIGDKIRVIGIPLTTYEENIVRHNQSEAFLIPHIYYFYVNIKDISYIEEKIRRTLEPTVHFLKRTEEGTDIDFECPDKSLGLAISPEACSCGIINFSQSFIYCDGYKNVTQLGYAYATHTDMTIEATLLECGTEYPICESSIVDAQYVDETKKINLLGENDFIILTIDAPVIEDKTIYRASIENGVLYVYTATSYYYQGIEVGKISDLVEGKTFTPTDCCYVSDFSSKFTGSLLSVSGKVESNLTENTRIAGIVRLNWYCNKGKVNEWHCGCKDFALQQANGCICDCDYVNSNKQVSYNYTTLEFHHNSTTASTILSTIGGLTDCIHYYLENTDEEGFVTLPDSENGWCKVKIYADDYYIQLYGEIIDEKHENRSTSITVHYNYLVGYDEETGKPIYSEDCGTIDVTITDEVCSCDSLTSVTWDRQTGETLTISAGSTSGSKYIGSFSVEYCIELFIVGSDENGKYIDPDGYFSAYTKTNSTYGYVYVTILKVLDEDKNIVIKGKYKNDQDEWVICDDELKLKITQKSCECNDFINKITTYTNFTQKDGSSITVARLYSGCGNGTLYVFDGENGYPSVSDIPDSSPLKSRITSMPNPCSTGYFEIGVVPPVEKEDGTKESFSLDFGLCQCKDDGTTDLDEHGKCVCIKEFTITDSFAKDCSDVNCYSYKLNLSLSESDLGTISKSGELQEVATFSVLPQDYESCYRLVVDCSNTGVETFDYIVSDTDSSKYVLRMKLNSSASVDSIIRVDFASKYIAGSSEQTCQEQYIRLKVTE